MDDKLYNQIFLKPRFQLEFEMNSQVLLDEIKKHLNDVSKYKGRNNGGYCGKMHP